MIRVLLLKNDEIVYSGNIPIRCGYVREVHMLSRIVHYRSRTEVNTWWSSSKDILDNIPEDCILDYLHIYPAESCYD